MIPNMMFIDTVQNENQFTVLMNTYENEFLGISQERIRLRELLGIIVPFPFDTIVFTGNILLI